jgi:hypothetical protein
MSDEAENTYKGVDNIHTTIIDISNHDDELIKRKIIHQQEAATHKVLNELVQVVCRQTELSTEEARDRLEKAHYDYMKVLNDYFGIKETVRENKASSVNQQIYGEIRNLMDIGAKKYRMDQERAQNIQQQNTKING